uniref:Fic family protein n=1 Tax=Endozoicomonas sp. Mp262 TaxID=2919499 RepID=UPI00351B96EC
MLIRKIPGTVLSNPITGEVVYTPPVGENVIRDLLGNWEAYLHADDQTDPLVKMAIAHYQFEAIHPFIDGNGRTGRIINILYLIEQKLLSLPILYLSRHIIRNKPDYYRLLSEVTQEQNWENWLLYMLKGIEDTAHWTTQKIEGIRLLMEDTQRHIQTQLPKIYSYELLQTLFAQPYCRIDSLVQRGIVKRQTASLYLKQLCSIGVLEEQPAGKEKLFVHPKLLKLMVQNEHGIEPY